MSERLPVVSGAQLIGVLQKLGWEAVRQRGSHVCLRHQDLDFEDVPFEVQPERRVGDGQFADLLTLREDRQAAALVVEVLELDGLQRARAQAVVEQQAQRESVGA